MKGSIDILLLLVIKQKDTYGYEIVQTLKEKSNTFYEMSHGTLYPALKRLEQKSLIESYWGESEVGIRRKFYRITIKGQMELEEKLNQWHKIHNLIQSCI
jgi:DNA-binding PadR family transcriptional regulator